MRSFATFLRLSAWPKCVFQNQLQCSETSSDSLSEATVFSMRDALVDGVRRCNTFTNRARQLVQLHGAENAITLRVESIWRDHVHDCIQPEVFSNSVKARSLVANYRRLPGGTEKLMATIIEDRVAALQASNPSTNVDFVLIEVRNDASKGGLTFRGRRLVDAVLLTRAFLVVPSHVVAYSNLFSTTCYVAAHLIDSSMTYEILAQHSTTSNGVLHTNLIDFFLWSSVQMRNIWLFAFARRCWTPASSMRGIAEFVVSDTSMLTIFAQFRKLEFRDSSILSVHEPPHSPRINGGVPLCFFRSRSSMQTLLVPKALMHSELDVGVDWDDWMLLAVTDWTRVPWSELLRCGGSSDGSQDCV
ncbi:hypothetical protein Gpo141_00005365 [Globisporangium polare]